MEDLTHKEMSRVATISTVDLRRQRIWTIPICIFIILAAIGSFIDSLRHPDHRFESTTLCLLALIFSSGMIERLSLYGLIQKLTAGHPLKDRIAAIDLEPLRRRKGILFIVAVVVAIILSYFRH